MHEITKIIDSLICDTPYKIANLANISAVIFEQMKNISWAGFYLMNDGKLVLGPFQGKVACIQIPVGKGVCGTAVANDETVVVPNVHEFPGHIACDCATNSEIVVPVHMNGKVVGVLDLDSKEFDNFGAPEKEVLEEIVAVLEKYIEGMR